MKKYADHILKLFVLSCLKFPQNSGIQLFHGKGRLQIQISIQLSGFLQLFANMCACR